MLKLLIEEIEQKKSEQEDPTEKEEENAKKKLDLAIQAAAFSVLGVAWSTNYETQQRNIDPFLTLLIQHISNVGHFWTLRVAAMNALNKFLGVLIIEDLSNTPSLLKPSYLKMIIDALSINLNDAKVGAVRTTALKVLSILLERVKGTKLLLGFVNQIKEQLEQVNTKFPNKHYEIQNLLVQLKQFDTV